VVLAMGRRNMTAADSVFLFSFIAAIIIAGGMKYGDWKSSRRGR